MIKPQARAPALKSMDLLQIEPAVTLKLMGANGLNSKPRIHMRLWHSHIYCLLAPKEAFGESSGQFEGRKESDFKPF